MRESEWLHRLVYMFAVAGLLVLSAVPSAPAAHLRGDWTELDEGRVGAYLWEVNAKRRTGVGVGGARRPCVQVGTTWELGPFNYRRSRSRSCTGPKGNLAASDSPLIATGVQPSSGNRVKMTAVGMIFGTGVQRVRITLSSGRQEMLRVHKLTRRQARSAKLKRFGYAAFAIRGLWCAERIVSQSAAGRTLWDSGTDAFRCQAGGSDKTSFE